MEYKTPCNEMMFKSFKNVIFSRFKRTLNKERVIDYINKYRGRYALNDSQNKEIENIIDKL
jgi:hypothetical protein